MPVEHEPAALPVVALIEAVSLGIELLAIAIILVAIVYGTARYVMAFLPGGRVRGAYQAYRVRLGRSLLLGLEILVAADIIRTVALDPTLNSIAVLGLLVVIRTFLSWSLVVEIEGRWPWQLRDAGGSDMELDTKVDDERPG